jgi:hypothetical protein
MTSVPDLRQLTAPVWPRARKLRRAGNAATVVWGVGVVAFVVLAASRATEELASAVGVLASSSFALGFLFKSLAHRLEWRAMELADAARREVISSTTRRR